MKNEGLGGLKWRQCELQKFAVLVLFFKGRFSLSGVAMMRVFVAGKLMHKLLGRAAKQHHYCQEYCQYFFQWGENACALFFAARR